MRDLALEVLAHLGVRLARQHLARLAELAVGGAVRAVRLDDRLQLRQSTAGRRGRLLVAGRVELGELRFELLQLGLQVGEAFEHADQRRRRSGDDRAGVSR